MRRRPQYTVSVAPASEPITLSQAQEHLRVDSADDADYITALISMVREYYDSITNRSSVATTWKLSAGDWADLYEKPQGNLRSYEDYIIPLCRTPLVSVTSVKYYAPGAAVQTTVSSSDYRVVTSEEPGFIQFVDAPPSVDDRADAIEILFVAGSGASDMDKHAMKLMLSHYYDIREPVVTGTIATEIPWGLKSLVMNRKIRGHF